MITYRKANTNDMIEAKRLLSYVWQDTYRKFYPAESIKKVTEVWHAPSALLSQIEDPDIYFGLAKDNDAIIGLATLRKVNPEMATLDRLYIHPDYQRQGIGSVLLDLSSKFCGNYPLTYRKYFYILIVWI